MNVVIATCAMWPELATGDVPLADELTGRGHTVRALPWNASPPASFTTADLVILRSNWDFHHHMDAFDAWLTNVAESAARLENAASLVRSHHHKSYILRYADHGVATPATIVLERFDGETAANWMDAQGVDRAVCKPAWGASGHQVELLHRDQLMSSPPQFSDDDPREVLLQEFMPGISEGELAMVFLAGSFSHALRRVPAGHDFRINSQYGGTTILDENVDPGAIDFAQGVVDLVAPLPTYARIDIVRSGQAYVLMEVELNEPALGLHLAPGAAAHMADALGA